MADSKDSLISEAGRRAIADRFRAGKLAQRPDFGPALEAFLDVLEVCVRGYLYRLPPRLDDWQRRRLARVAELAGSLLHDLERLSRDELERMEYARWLRSRVEGAESGESASLSVLAPGGAGVPRQIDEPELSALVLGELHQVAEVAAASDHGTRGRPSNQAARAFATELARQHLRIFGERPPASDRSGFAEAVGTALEESGLEASVKPLVLHAVAALRDGQDSTGDS